jgi:anti-anti-sigma factor
MQLSLRLVPVGDTTLVVVLTGELDSTTRPVLAAFLDPLPRSHVKHVVVAAADLWFCDLNGLEQLAITHRALRAKGGQLAVAEPRTPLRRLITLMAEHTQPAIPLYTSMPEALAATGVETYEMPAPIPRRHLPRLRPARRVPSTGGVRDRPRARQEPDVTGPREPADVAGPREPAQAYEDLRVELRQINAALTARTSELDEADRFVSAVVRSLADAVVVLDDELRVIGWSPGAEELWGLPADEAVGGALASLDLGLPLEILMPRLRAALTDGSTPPASGIALDAVNGRGRPTPLAVHLSRVRTEDDQAHVLIMAMNVLGPDASPGR